MLEGLTIITGLDAGRTVAQIVQFNNLKISTVCNVKQHYNNFMLPGELSSDRKMHRSRSDACEARIVARLQDLVNQDPSRSMRSLAKELDISQFFVRKKMAQDICYKLYALGQ